jgi:hypothetical protein
MQTGAVGRLKKMVDHVERQSGPQRLPRGRPSRQADQETREQEQDVPHWHQKTGNEAPVNREFVTECPAALADQSIG